jgi:hypothetical protein
MTREKEQLRRSKPAQKRGEGAQDGDEPLIHAGDQVRVISSLQSCLNRSPVFPHSLDRTEVSLQSRRVGHVDAEHRAADQVLALRRRFAVRGHCD